MLPNIEMLGRKSGKLQNHCRDFSKFTSSFRAKLMKHLFNFLIPPILIISIVSGCSDLAKKNGAIDRFSWLQGHWADTAMGFYESWEKSEKGILHGNGYQLSEGDTVFGESLSIEKSGENWAYVVSFGNEKTVFRLMNVPGDSLVFENPENEFPKRITYLKKGQGKISVIIENPGDSDKISHFNFTSIK